MLECSFFSIGKGLINNQAYDCAFDNVLSDDFSEYTYFAFFQANNCNKPDTFDCDLERYTLSFNKATMCDSVEVSCDGTISCQMVSTDTTPIPSTPNVLILLEL